MAALGPEASEPFFLLLSLPLSTPPHPSKDQGSGHKGPRVVEDRPPANVTEVLFSLQVPKQIGPLRFYTGDPRAERF